VHRAGPHAGRALRRARPGSDRPGRQRQRRRDRAALRRPAPERLRTLTLTNCDTHDNWPPEAVRPIIEAARSGALTEAARLMLADPGFARSPAGLGVGYADPSAPTDEAIRVYLEPLVATPERIENVRRYWLP